MTAYYFLKASVTLFLVVGILAITIHQQTTEHDAEHRGLRGSQSIDARVIADPATVDGKLEKEDTVRGRRLQNPVTFSELFALTVSQPFLFYPFRTPPPTLPLNPENQGFGNVGLGNAGIDNLGLSNAGIGNLGIENDGIANLGRDNNGIGNTGLRNAGINNVGQDNVGIDNRGNFNNGIGNSGTGNVGIGNSGRGNNGINLTGNFKTGIGP